MLRYIIQRPIAVLIIFIALLVAGVILIKKIPVSLLPGVDVPKIVIRLDYRNTAAPVLEQNVLRPIRESLANLNGLKSIESQAANHTGILNLDFEYGIRMDLAYVEVNEKLDRLANSLPRDLSRPQVMRINTSDIPVIRLQVTPKDTGDYIMVSELAEKVLKRRLEQIDGVSLVDINGRQTGIISISPHQDLLNTLGMDNSHIVQSIQNSNRELGGLSINDGQYRYFVKLVNNLEGVGTIKQLPVLTKDGQVIALSRLATVMQEPDMPVGYHLFNEKEGLVITVQKQSGSRMNEVVPRVKEVIRQFKNDYRQVDFDYTQDQTFLLDAGIGNLYQDIIYGGVLTIILLFMFLGNWASPVLMSISIPVSLIITFVFFYLFGISFNIISLSGLALGIGMLIDNSIVVIDHITRKRRSGLSMMESSVEGTREVMAPVTSQVLTTIAVYAPLILLGGMAGTLVADQSIALTISLGMSLLVAFVLAPLLFKLFLKNSPEKLKDDTIFFKWVSKGYHRMIDYILQHRKVFLLITIAIMPVGFLIIPHIPVSNLPNMEKRESLLTIDWNEAVDARENRERIKSLQQVIKEEIIVSEAEIGIRQFLLQQDNNTIQKAQMYYACASQEKKERTDRVTKEWLMNNYPLASSNIIDAPNAFTQLFVTATPYLEARFKSSAGYRDSANYGNLLDVLKNLLQPAFTYGPGLIKEPVVDIELDYYRMATYGITRSQVESLLQQLFGTFTISEIKRFGDIKTIRLKTDRQTLEEKLNATIAGMNEEEYALRNFIRLATTEQYKYITADRTGEYKSICFESAPDVPRLVQQITETAVKTGFRVDFTGRYFENRARMKEMGMAFLLVVALLFLILAIQFESLVQPVLVMLTIPLGITGAIFILWMAGGTLNVMAAIGFIVVLGLIVDDPILKIDTLNRLRKKYKAEGLPMDEKLLKRMIHEAGDICLKPLLMVSLTTSIALVPVLFIPGLGNDLQKPLALVIIGGLTIGTFFTTWFIPLAYWYINKWRSKI